MTAVRRLTLALAIAASLAAALAPAPARAQTRRGGGYGAGGRPSLGLLVGFEDGHGDTGLALRVDGELPLSAIAPALRTSLVLSVGYSHWSSNTGFFSSQSSSLGILKLTPALRLSLGSSPTVRPYLDGGVGLHYASYSVDQVDAFGNVSSVSDSDVSLHLRFAAGLLLQVSGAVALGAEIDLLPYFGKVDDTTFALLFEVSIRM